MKNTYQKFLIHFRLKRFKKGEIILCQGEVPECGYIIKSGIVKTYNLTMQGEEKPIGFDVQDEVFPMAWIFGRIKHAQYYYEAFTDCEVYCVPRDQYMKYVETDTDQLRKTFNYFIDRFIGSQMRINALEQSKAPSKVINTIHFLCLRYGKDVKKDTVKIQLPLTQQDLANFIGLTRETTGIELKKLHQKGILTYHKQSYLVRTDKLNDLLDEDYSLGIVLEARKAIDA